MTPQATSTASIGQPAAPARTDGSERRGARRALHARAVHRAVVALTILVAIGAIGRLAGAAVPGAGTVPGVPAVAAQGPQGTVSLVGQFGGDVMAVAADGDLMFIGIGPRLGVFDISDPTAPRQIGLSEPLPGVLVDLAVEGDRVYAISNGLAVLDIGDPAEPRLLGHITLGEIDPLYGWVGPSSLAVDDGYAYLAGNVTFQIGRLNIVDARTPGALRLLTRVEQYTATAVAVSGDRAYLALRACVTNCGPNHVAMLVYDVSNPASPRVLGDYAEPRGARAIALSGTLALLGESGCRLNVVDVSDSTDPRTASCVAINTSGVVVDVAATDSRAFVLDAGGDLWTVELRPGGGRFAVTGSLDVAPQGIRVAVFGDRTFVAAGPYGGHVVDAARPSAMRRLAFVRPPGAFVDALVDGATAYVAGYYSGLHVLDVRDARVIRELGAVAVPNGAVRLAKVGGHVYVLTWATGAGSTQANPSLRAVAVSDPAQPREVGSQVRSGAADLATDGQRLFVAGTAGLEVLDPAANPANPALVGRAQPGTGTTFTRVAASGGRAYVVAQNRRGGTGGGLALELRVFDVADPANPRLAGSTALGAGQPGITGIAVQDNLVYLSARLEVSVLVVDVRDAARPTVVGLWETLDNIAPSGIAASGRWAYLSTWAGLRVLDVIVPGYPAQVALYDTPEIGTPNYLTIATGQDGRLYMPRYDGGLLIVAADVPPRPTPTTGPSPTRTASATPFPTLTPDGKPTQVVTEMPGPTRRPTRTPTPTLRPGETPPTPLPTIGPGPTRTAGPGRRTPTPTATKFYTPGALSPTPSRTLTPSRTPFGGTASATWTPSRTLTPSRTPTGTISPPAPTATRTPTGTISPPAPTGTRTPTATLPPGAAALTATAAVRETATAGARQTATAGASRTPRTPTATGTPATATATLPPGVTPSRTPTASATWGTPGPAGRIYLPSVTRGY